MSEFIKVAKLSELKEDSCFKVTVKGDDILLIKKDTEVFAIHDLCTHSDYSMCEGNIEEFEIECPLHFARFDIRSGEVTAPPAFDDLRTYKVRINGEDVEVEV